MPLDMDQATVPPGARPLTNLAGAEDRTVTWETRSTRRSMLRMPYLLTHGLPNAYLDLGKN